MTPSSRASRADLLPQRAAALGVEPGSGLVQEQDPRAVHQCQRQIQPAAHAAGVAAHLAVGGVSQAHALDQVVAAAAALGLGQAVQRGLKAHVLARGEVVVQRGLLQRRSDVLAHLRAVLAHLVARHPRRARGGRQQGGEHVNRGGLPGAIGAEEAVDLARVHVEVHAVYGSRALLVLLNEVFDLDGGRVVGGTHGRRRYHDS